MRPRARSALLWGAVGLLTVPVAGLAVRPLGGPAFGAATLAGLAAAAAAVVAAVAYRYEARLARKGRT